MPIVSKASEYIALKNRIKTEVLRRKYTGDVSAYGGVSYDYTTTPVIGNPVLIEHYNKINTSISAVNPSGLLPNAISKESIREIATLDATVAVLESKVLTSVSTSTGCASSCTGLCSTTCTGGCQSSCSGCSGCGGCSGSCIACVGCEGCSGSCSSGCGDSCSSGCGGSCSWNCSGSCSLSSV